MSKLRRIGLVCLTPDTDAGELEGVRLPSYGVRRILAAAASDPELENSKFGLIDYKRSDVEAYVNGILKFEPDLLGFSVYVWSLPLLVQVAREVKRQRPQILIVFGGPSARTPQLDLPPYAHPHAYVDGVVSTEGEETFREIGRLPELTREGLASIPGIHIPGPGGWKSTGPRSPITNLDTIASPFQLGLMEAGGVAYLETFRGCPFTCRFCEWGASDGANKVFSKEYIVKELEAFARNGSVSMYNLDAGLNLNSRAFRNLYLASKEVDYFRKAEMWCEVYPSYLTDEHIEFISGIDTSWLGIGLQSLDEAVLKGQDRPFGRDKFEKVIGELSQIATAEIQIISGLPGDSPDGFRKTLEYARSLPASVRVYHALVLPDALLSRSRPEWHIEFDPVTMEMISTTGWTRDELTDMREELRMEAIGAGGAAGQYWWAFPPPGDHKNRGGRSSGTLTESP